MLKICALPLFTLVNLIVKLMCLYIIIKYVIFKCIIMLNLYYHSGANLGGAGGVACPFRVEEPEKSEKVEH